jgi:ketosteroid isomerase-like protein
MIKPFLIFVGVFGSMALGQWRAFGDPTSITLKTAQDEIQAAYDRSDEASSTKDIDAVFAICEPDFIVIEGDGTQMNLPKVRRAFGFSMDVQSSHNSTKVLGIVINGDGSAVLSIVDHQVFSIMFNNLVTVTDDTKCQDYWVHTTSGWREKRSRVISNAQSVQGDGFKPNGVFHW